jgi:hypothetical protein
VLAAASGLAALAFLSAACGGHSSDKGSKGTGSTGSNTSANAPTTDQQLKFAQCMRKNGVNMPDPKPGQNGQSISIGGNGASPEKIEKAGKACRSVAGIPAPTPLSPEQQDKALKFAACMRRHGIDMPDPKFDGSGGARPAPTGDPDKLAKAEEACSKFQ